MVTTHLSWALRPEFLPFIDRMLDTDDPRPVSVVLDEAKVLLGLPPDASPCVVTVDGAEVSESEYLAARNAASRNR